MPTTQAFPSFDMWRDYMRLSSLVGTLRDQAPVQQGPHAQSPPREPSACSPASSPSSSPSDTGSTGAQRAEHCRFCRQNGESPRVYRSHALRAGDGRLRCPILRRYVCPRCGATGDRAHTRKYCPEAQRQEAQRQRPEYKLW